MTNLEEHRTWLHVKEIIRERLSLTEDKADDALIDERIRGDIHMKGSNLWILMFAIFVASIGLNVNSTAVIIGAMLISPLMGPIMGIGYGAGINDFALLRRAFKNLAIATFIGLLTSTLYFLISPLETAQSELLSRTTPTVWDVLIGLFGGLAGIVAVTRKEKTNVIPGVAIATALMPPLCTAGFGLATGHWHYFFGAFYLYTINFVFIALSAFLIVRAFQIAEKKYVDPEIAKRAQRYIIAVAVATMLPSSYLAYQLVEEEVFKSKASTFVNENLNFPDTNVAQVKINPKSYEIKVFLIGAHISTEKLNTISLRMAKGGLKNAQLKVYQNGERDNIDISTLKTDIVTDLYKNAQAKLEAKDTQIALLREKIQINSLQKERHAEIPDELQTLFPKITKCILSETNSASLSDQNLSSKKLILNIETKGRLNKNERDVIEKWVKKRAKNTNVILFVH
jgi:uncharacterized hydrophobic protein (TIGR00271 family)